ncbi:hypothetical protein [Pseudoteredinibacter isoporae]|uniref:ABC-type uncharacterized transport system substrate-binding protein n=1 Tax=Pseudoteredinibacter isoporae TaxID=570281 RepID=A0A7X0JPF9_9GAMM|nr:hypothetical protein [Pseudoteredinibacter isoporae]MBB6519882.1 ABC-type uncharacterized transport system substrate-binding protein [Pseudoteredinibacter isoporae]NHO85460.1 hypothetical protein [Pseudoteredinibacter isoporae]NIB26088.1 hypothetical protein [Pseudoteredinibacter isoporae]
MPDNKPALIEAAEEIKNAIHKKGVRKNELHLQLGLEKTAPAFQSRDLILTLGPQAASYALENSEQNMLVFTYVEEAYIREKAADRKPGSWAAVVINQPLERMQKLANLLLRDRNKKTVLIANSRGNELVNQQAARLRAGPDIQILHRSINANARDISRLEDEFYQAGLVLAPLDRALWRGKNARLLLHQAYSYKVPVVAHSRAFTKAGAMMALYLGKSEVAEETAALAYTWLAANSFGQQAIIYPAARIDINDNIARALRFDPVLIRRQINEDTSQADVLGRYSSAR